MTGYVVFLNGNPLSWVSRAQRTISLASEHAEYNAINELIKEILYVKYIMDLLFMNPELPVVIFCDNSGAIFLSKNQETRMSKHLDIKVHFIRHYVENGTIKIVYVKTDRNLADSFTKNGGKESYDLKYEYMKNMCSDV